MHFVECTFVEISSTFFCDSRVNKNNGDNKGRNKLMSFLYHIPTDLSYCYRPLCHVKMVTRLLKTRLIHQSTEPTEFVLWPTLC